ncbi:MAG: DegT/DnrJ/EryC1/StrS family aminotransferase [Thermodesulfobacteriota bacterium]
MFNRHRRVIPYCVPSWGWREHLIIAKCLITGTVINGRSIRNLYDLIREMTGVPHVFGFGSGAEAISACLRASGIGPGHEVVMPSFCCHSVADAVRSCGAEPLFCEVGRDLNPDGNHILSLLNPSVRAIIFPHLFGRPGDIQLLEEKLHRSGDRDRILLIDDAAQSFGACIDSRPIGTFGDAGIISFGPGKMTTASGGGLLLTNSPALAETIGKLPASPPGLPDKIRELFYWLIFRRWRKYTARAFPYLGFFFRKTGKAEGHLARLANIDAAIALSQIRRLDDIIAMRRKVKNQLDEVLEDIRRTYHLPIRFPEELPAGRRETFTKQVFFLDGAGQAGFSAKQFYAFLHQAGIELQPLYSPLHLNPRYRKPEARLAFTEQLSDTVLNLSNDPTISPEDIRHIRKTLNNFFQPADQRQDT